MDIQGFIVKKLSDQKGTSQATGKEWRNQEWLVRIPGMRENFINFRVRNEERCNQWDDFYNNMPKKDAMVVVSFAINAHEFNGKWFNEIEAWNIAIAF